MEHKNSFASMSVDVVVEEIIEEDEINGRFKNENWLSSQDLVNEPLLIPATQAIEENTVGTTQIIKDRDLVNYHDRTKSTELLRSSSSPLTKESTMDEYVDYPDYPIHQSTSESLPPAGQMKVQIDTEKENEHLFSLPANKSPKRQSSDDSEPISPKKRLRKQVRSTIHTKKEIKKQKQVIKVAHHKIENDSHEKENAKLLDVIIFYLRIYLAMNQLYLR
jgi:hypothetical protein